MRRIVHISDLHFGRVNPALLQPLLSRMEALQPDVVAVSGDLTQRAREEEFSAAGEFLRQIPYPKIVVPGNHDISLWNLYRRFARPLERYRRHIGSEHEPVFHQEGLFVLGLNTARSLAWKEGRLSREQIARIRHRFSEVSAGTIKVLVVHHPFLPPEGKNTAAVGRAKHALEALEHSNADLILAGHLHRGFSRQTSSYYRLARRSILVVQSGTTLSSRTRDEQNSFNVVDVQVDSVQITVEAWNPASNSFHPQQAHRYEKRGAWVLA